MNFDQFIKQWTNKYCEVAGSANAKNQCVDLVNAYIRDVLGLPIIEWTNAVDFPKKAGSAYEWIKNTPTGVPQKGDIVIWGGGVGHIAIFIEGNVNNFRSFDQNFPTGSVCKVVNHPDYKNVLGWLRKKVVSQPTQPSAPAVTITKEEYERLKKLLSDNEQTVLQKARKIEELETALITQTTESARQLQIVEERVVLLQKENEELKKTTLDSITLPALLSTLVARVLKLDKTYETKQ